MNQVFIAQLSQLGSQLLLKVKTPRPGDCVVTRPGREERDGVVEVWN
jgi:hypothetical protein